MVCPKWVLRWDVIRDVCSDSRTSTAYPQWSLQYAKIASEENIQSSRIGYQCTAASLHAQLKSKRQPCAYSQHREDLKKKRDRCQYSDVLIPNTSLNRMVHAPHRTFTVVRMPISQQPWKNFSNSWFSREPMQYLVGAFPRVVRFEP